MASLIKRGTIYYAQYMVGKKAKRISLDTSSLQLAKDKLRTLESSLFRGNDKADHLIVSKCRLNIPSIFTPQTINCLSIDIIYYYGNYY